MQGVRIDADKRELQRLAIDIAEHYSRDKQVEASNALIHEVGALLMESGGAKTTEICTTALFTAKAGDLGLRVGFCSRFVREQAEPYVPHEG